MLTLYQGTFLNCLICKSFLVDSLISPLWLLCGILPNCSILRSTNFFHGSICFPLSEVSVISCLFLWVSIHSPKPNINFLLSVKHFWIPSKASLPISFSSTTCIPIRAIIKLHCNFVYISPFGVQTQMGRIWVVALHPQCLAESATWLL